MTDFTTPLPPSLVTLINDGGNSALDNITGASRLLFSGEAPPDATVHAYLGDQLVGTSFGAGMWILELNTDLPEGTHTLSFRTVDEDGHASEIAAELTVTIDTSEAAPTLLNLVKLDNEQIVVGHAAAGTIINLYDSGLHIGYTIANPDGEWSTNAYLVDSGEHRLSATATDEFGNVSALSAELVVMLAAASAPGAAAVELIGVAPV